jgi:phenylalanyl-tRNA synthetase beta chain
VKFSETCLREWINPSIDILSLCDQVTTAGLEVESITKMSGEFYGIVVGEILECTLHPKSKKLFLLIVNVNITKNLRIICRDQNWL